MARKAFVSLDRRDARDRSGLDADARVWEYPAGGSPVKRIGSVQATAPRLVSLTAQNESGFPGDTTLTRRLE